MPYSPSTTNVVTRNDVFPAGKSHFIWAYSGIETTYVEDFVPIKLPQNRDFSVKYTKRARREFKLSFDLMRYLEESPENPEKLSLNQLEDFYYTHREAKPFYFNHTIYGVLKVRFKEPIGLDFKKGNNGWVSGFTCSLVEMVEDDNPFQRGKTFTSNLYPFMGCTFETTYPKDSSAIMLGANYIYAVNHKGKPQRTVTLNYDYLMYFYDSNNNIVLSQTPNRNLALLELFYHSKRLTETFSISHPSLGLLTVRFKEPLTIPKLAKNGIVPNIRVTLVEVA